MKIVFDICASAFLILIAVFVITLCGILWVLIKSVRLVTTQSFREGLGKQIDKIVDEMRVQNAVDDEDG